MNILQKDRDYVWHPFTPQWGWKAPVNIVKGEGVYLIDERGNKYLDAISSWWVNLHGHCNPYISKKASEQLFQLEHALFSDFTHPSAVRLAERLLEHLPKAQSKIFYSDNGSTSVEVALKMALQYWSNKGFEKNIFIAFENAYHGDTFGGMSVGARNVFNNAFEKLLFTVNHIPLPTKGNFSRVKDLLAKAIKNGKVAGFIFEPLVQGAAGMLMYEAEHLDELISICKENKIITIADEVMTGFGRTGKFFASDHLENSPDIFCLSKGLTGGYLPLGVTSCAEFIHEAFVTEDRSKTFFHGHSYTANPTSCSAALASLDLMEKEETWSQVKMIEEAHKAFSSKISSHKNVRSARFKGTILAIELNTEEQTHYLNNASESISDFFLERKIILRPLGNVFYLIPPYVITKHELEKVYASIEEFLSR
jgi:adenosylmethionine-8-amino-7-oxononanoate aminotransferase